MKKSIKYWIVLGMLMSPTLVLAGGKMTWEMRLIEGSEEYSTLDPQKDRSIQIKTEMELVNNQKNLANIRFYTEELAQKLSIYVPKTACDFNVVSKFTKVSQIQPNSSYTINGPNDTTIKKNNVLENKLTVSMERTCNDSHSTLTGVQITRIVENTEIKDAFGTSLEEMKTCESKFSYEQHEPIDNRETENQKFCAKDYANYIEEYYPLTYLLFVKALKENAKFD